MLSFITFSKMGKFAQEFLGLCQKDIFHPQVARITQILYFYPWGAI